MKKKLFGLLACVLCLSFCLAGCNLFVDNSTIKNDEIVATYESTTLTYKELIKGYNSYYSTFYKNNSNDAEKAMEDLVEYLLAKKVYIQDAEELIESEDLPFTNAEKNYIWDKTFSTVVSYLETFEKEIKTDLGIEIEDEELEQEENYVYTPYTKTVKVIYDETLNQYKLVAVENVMVCVENEDGEEEYKYVTTDEYAELLANSEIISQDTLLTVSNFVYEKLYKNISNESLTTEQRNEKVIAQEAYRRYLDILRLNEKGKGLSTDDAGVFQRELERVYEIVYENLMVNKLYNYKSLEIVKNDISEDDVLEYYLQKVQECYERYELDPNAYAEEITTGISSAKPYGNYYTTGTLWQEDVYYIPEDDEQFVYVSHIAITLSDEKIQQINDLKAECEAGGKSEEYFNTELAEIINPDEIFLNERDSEGYIVVKSTDEDAINVTELCALVNTKLAEIDTEYGVTPSTAGSLSTEQYYNYIFERADLFNEYSYKYSTDQGTIQIQSTQVSGYTNENWYNYAVGLGSTDRSFAEEFITELKDLHTAGKITAISDNPVYMSGWAKEKDSQNNETGVEKVSLSGYTIQMYCGEVNNIFDWFNDNDVEFTLERLRQEETSGINGVTTKNYSLQVMDYSRLGLTGNKTLLDLIYEKVFDKAYSNMTTAYEESIKDKIQINTNVYSNLI